MAILAAVLTAASATNATAETGKQACEAKLAPRLCLIKWHHHRVQVFKRRMGLPTHRIGYDSPIYTKPQLRGYYLWVWKHKDKHWRHKLRVYLASPWLHWSGGMCIHHYEGAWNAYNSAGPYYGGFQADRSFYTTYGAPELRANGGRDPRYWSPAEQLHMAWRGYQDRGYAPWPNTARRCGLL